MFVCVWPVILSTLNLCFHSHISSYRLLGGYNNVNCSSFSKHIRLIKPLALNLNPTR